MKVEGDHSAGKLVARRISPEENAVLILSRESRQVFWTSERRKTHHFEFVDHLPPKELHMNS